MSGASTSTGLLVSDLVALALRQIGVGAQGTTPSSADTADGLLHLNLMLAQWQRRRWLVPALVDLTATSTGRADMFVGPGMDFNTAQRPGKIETAFARYFGNGMGPADFSAADFSELDFQTNNLDKSALAIDYPLTIIESREDYSAISIKNLRTWPTALFYSPEYPNGRVNIWPIPAVDLWEIHLVCAQILSPTLALTDPIALAPEYADAIMWNLAARLAPSYGQEASPTVASLARGALQTIRNSNWQGPTLSLPEGLVGGYRRGYGFNIFAGY